MRDRGTRVRGRLAWWGLGIGAASGIGDTLFFLTLGIDFTVAGRNLTPVIAIWLAASFALLGFAVGYLIDARARARRDAETIEAQMRALETSQRIASQNEKLAAIGRLAAGVAHEVRNPLGVIRASASMIQESFEPGEEPHRACDFICEEIDRLNGLITSLLTFARPTEPRLQAVSIEKVVERALQLQAGELEQRGIAVERETFGSVPEVVADPDLLAQLVLGLVTNAVEALVRGGRIALRIESEDDSVYVEVADSGPGISLEDAGRVFEPFFTTKPTGTGLGLAMTARIVEVHGGHIEVCQGRGAGPAGAGACFRVRIPIDAAAARSAVTGPRWIAAGEASG